MPTSLSEGPEKTFDDRYGNSSPRYMRENHYAVLVIFENFLGFHSQEFSITLRYFNKSCKDGMSPLCVAKIYNNPQLSKLLAAYWCVLR